VDLVMGWPKLSAMLFSKSAFEFFKNRKIHISFCFLEFNCIANN
jgi:hypothetical protein